MLQVVLLEHPLKSNVLNSPDAKWPFLVQVCFVAIIKFFC